MNRLFTTLALSILVSVPTFVIEAVFFNNTAHAQLHDDQPHSRPIPDVSKMFMLQNVFERTEHGLLLLREKKRQIELYRFLNGQLRLVERATPWAQVTHAVAISDQGERKIALAYEYGQAASKPRLRNRVRVVVYDMQLANPVVALDEHTENGYINELREYNGKLFVNFFHSPGFSKGGYLRKDKNNVWRFKRLIAGESHEVVDLDGNSFVIGSALPPEEARLKELRMFENDLWRNLPSIRGISAIRFMQLDQDAEFEILIADGLANSSQKTNVPLLGVLDFDARQNQFARSTVFTPSKRQKAIDKIVVVPTRDGQRVIIKGWRNVSILHPEQKWKSQVVYTKKSENAEDSIDFACLRTKLRSMILAIHDGDVRLIKIDDSAFIEPSSNDAQIAPGSTSSEQYESKLGGPMEGATVNLLHYFSYDNSADNRYGEPIGYGTGLDLSNTEVTDSDLAQLSGEAFKEVKWLNLRDTQISDEGLQHIKGIPLKTLILEGTMVRGTGFHHLQGLPLKTLILEGTAVDDAGLKNLKGLSVESLVLTRTPISDEGILYLLDLPLKSLSLYSTPITDLALQYLRGFPLKRLYLTGTYVTDLEIDRLKQTIPDIAVIY